jgi:GNAT superfamily N-acetyltransferase
MVTQHNLTKFSLDLRKKYPVIQNLSLLIQECPTTNVRYIELVFIRIKKSQQQKGYGSTILSAIVQFADDNNIQIRLTPAAMYGTPIKVLYGFYTKNGFSHMDETTMVYYPQKIKKTPDKL